MKTESEVLSKGPLSQSDLESLLWKASVFLRGNIDSGEYKQYIFGLLFYKRLCDVWNEEFEALLVKFNGDEEQASLPEHHQFHIPYSCMWWEEQRTIVSDVPSDESGKPYPRVLKEWDSNIGVGLSRALREIEASNPRLRGVFQDVDFRNAERFSDTMLRDFLEHFETHRMRCADVDSYVLGNAYEYLIAKFADDAGKKGGEFYTPKEVVRLLVQIIEPTEGDTIYDPTCGAGGMFLETIQHLRRQQKDTNSIAIFGQEKNLNTWGICQISLCLNDVHSYHIEKGDTIRAPKHLLSGDTLKKFDVILANPPFSLKNWGYEQWKEGDPYQRDAFGIPPKAYGDYAFIQHMLSSMSQRGKIGLVVPMGVLFRGGKEQGIRRKIVEMDLIETIISLGQNLFYGASIPAAIIIIKAKKESHKQGKILFVNAEKEVVVGVAQSHLSNDNISRIAKVVLSYQEEPFFSRIVEAPEIVDNSFNLNVVRYVQTEPAQEPLDVHSIYAEIEDLRGQLEQEYNHFSHVFAGLFHD